MATKYFALLTNIGAAKLANATALGAQVEITQMAVGDGNGALPTPNPAQTALTHELRRAQLNMLTIDPVNTNQIIAEQVIPEDVGGWWIREIGLFDKDGDLIAVANCAETYKPQLQEGSGRVQVIRVILIVSSTEAVTLKIDPSVVLATRKYVDDAVIEVKAYVDQKLAEHVTASNPHQQYLKTVDIVKYLPVGVPLPYPAATPPAGWLKCNGASFDKAAYPGLAVVFPSGNLPDLRGEFIRGWDDGRGVDPGRTLMVSQAATKLPSVYTYAENETQGVLVTPPINAYQGVYPTEIRASDYEETTTGSGSYFSTSKLFPNGSSGLSTFRVRPRNIAFNYIVRAA